MFNSIAHTSIDVIQTSKKVLIDMTIKHDKLANIFTTFIDSQTAYTKEATNLGIKTMSNLFLLMTAPNFGRELVESFNEKPKTKKNTTTSTKE
jgi:hypothetical protein